MADDSLNHMKDEILLGFKIPWQIHEKAEAIRIEKFKQQPHDSNFKFKKNFYAWIIGQWMKENGHE